MLPGSERRGGPASVGVVGVRLDLWSAYAGSSLAGPARCIAQDRREFLLEVAKLGLCVVYAETRPAGETHLDGHLDRIGLKLSDVDPRPLHRLRDRPLEQRRQTIENYWKSAVKLAVWMEQAIPPGERLECEVELTFVRRHRKKAGTTRRRICGAGAVSSRI